MEEHFCILPWIHLHPRPDGRVTLCCVDHINSVGSFQTHTLTEIANSDEMNLIRKKMMNNFPVKNCSQCSEREASGGVSYRINSNKKYDGLITELRGQTTASGQIQYPFKMLEMNIRYSNLCNFACRTCGGENSSKWRQENKEEISVINMSVIYFLNLL